jgi:hypothetical protein
VYKTRLVARKAISQCIEKSETREKREGSFVWDSKPKLGLAGV